MVREVRVPWPSAKPSADAETVVLVHRKSGGAANGPSPVPSLSAWSTETGSQCGEEHEGDLSSASSGRAPPEILRGAQLSYVLSRAGALWRTSPVDMDPRRLEAAHNHSQPCERLDVFISQTWASPGWEKHLALLVHYYWKAAAVAGFASCVALFLLDAKGLLPTFTVEDEAFFLKESVKVCPWGFIPPLVGLTVLLLGPALRAVPHLVSDPLVFFDAVCINQNDEELKVQGIYSLGDFLAMSSQLVVMWTPNYLRRLWCVYELATFSADADLSRIVWMPVCKQKLLFFMFCASAWNCCALYFSMSRVLGGSIQAILTCCLPLQMYLIVRVYSPYAKEVRSLSEQFEEFDVGRAECRNPADRVYITQGIIDKYGSLDAFNRYVRGPLKQKVAASMAGAGMTYAQLAGTISPVACLAAQLTAAHARTEYPPSLAATMSITWAVHAMVVNPIIFKMAFVLSTFAAKHCRGKAADVACTVAITFLLCVMHALALALTEAAKREPGPNSAYCVFVFSLWRAVFRR